MSRSRWACGLVFTLVIAGESGCGDDGRHIPPTPPLVTGAPSFGGGSGDDGGAADGTADTGGAAGTPAVGPRGCSDLFDPDRLAEYTIEISPDEWAKLDFEFHNREAVEAAGQDVHPFHPIVFHYRDQTVSDAQIRLKGQSSWRHTVRDDGARAKMQFVISFEEVNPSAKFHGVSKVALDMPNIDRTFLQERLAFHVLQNLLGRPAPCASSARLTINGQYYGLFSNEERVGHGFLKRVYPEAPDGDLFEAGRTPVTNELSPNWDRLKRLWDAHDLASMAAVVDLEDSLSEWAAEAMLNDGDGYWGGGHNFYVYDYPGKGYRWLPQDKDATFNWLVRSDGNPFYWWASRSTSQRPGLHYRLVIKDPDGRAQYLVALKRQLGHWDVGLVQGWIDAWSAQIADAVAADPHTVTSVAQHTQAIAGMRAEVADRPANVQKFIACEEDKDAPDGDGDGFAWCNDCNDANAAVNPGAVEICGNGVDDDCNGLPDAEDGCAPSSTPM